MTWRFWRWRREAAADREAPEDYSALARIIWTNHMLANGWRQSQLFAPNRGVVEVMRHEWPMSSIWDVAQIRPETNSNGLWWREWKGPTFDGAIIDQPATGPL